MHPPPGGFLGIDGGLLGSRRDLLGTYGGFFGSGFLGGLSGIMEDCYILFILPGYLGIIN
jgi:hypothetical protein